MNNGPLYFISDIVYYLHSRVSIFSEEERHHHEVLITMRTITRVVFTVQRANLKNVFRIMISFSFFF